MSKDLTPTFNLTPRNFDEAMQFATLMSESDLVPQGYQGRPGNILVAIQKGHEIGLSPMAALETISVINGRPTLYGDGLLALVQGSAVYAGIDESHSTEQAGVCTVTRKGEPPYTVTFTLEDARRAGLLGKAGPWTQYTKRMLQLRARSFALRDKFADVLKGMVAAEEVLDTVATAQVEPEPSSLKDKLRAQIEGPAQAPAPPEPEALAVPTPTPAAAVPADDLYDRPETRAATAGHRKAMTDTEWDAFIADAKNYPVAFLETIQFLKIPDEHKPINRAVRERFREQFLIAAQKHGGSRP